MRKSTLLALVAVALLAALTVVPNAAASPPYSRSVYYYEGCGESAVLVGTAYRDCGGHWTYDGQQSGDWKEVEDVECYGNEYFDDYYEWCNGQWVHVSYPDCSC
jgi:hypothetical protein